MERAQSAVVNLGVKQEKTSKKGISIYRAAGMIIFMAVAFRMLMIGISSLVAFNQSLGLVNNIFTTINNLSYGLTIPIAIAIYLWFAAQEQSLLLETLGNLLRTRS